MTYQRILSYAYNSYRHILLRKEQPKKPDFTYIEVLIREANGMVPSYEKESLPITLHIIPQITLFHFLDSKLYFAISLDLQTMPSILSSSILYQASSPK